MKLFFTVVLFILALNLFSQNREHAFEVNKRLGRGINYGNMFEAPSETEWGNPWKPQYAKMIADLGFNHVRIPIRWEPAGRRLIWDSIMFAFQSVGNQPAEVQQLRHTQSIQHF